MATLIRQDIRRNDLNQFSTRYDISRGIPQPFPSAAEREQEELLESLATEELHLDEAVSSYREGATPHDNMAMLPHRLDVHRISSGEYARDIDTALSQDRFVSCTIIISRLRRG